MSTSSNHPLERSETKMPDVPVLQPQPDSDESTLTFLTTSSSPSAYQSIRSSARPSLPESSSSDEENPRCYGSAWSNRYLSG